MSFGFGIGDFLAVGTLAWNVYRSCKGSSESFRNISGEVLSLHAVLKESEETLLEPPQQSASEARLKVVLSGCSTVLNDLQALIKKYESLGSKSKLTWDRLKWCNEDIAEIRVRLISNVTLLTAFISTSQASVQSKLDKYLEEYQQGKRERSIISVQTVDSLSYDDKVAWRTIRKELEEIGITVTAFEANRDFILRWLSQAIQTGALEEQHSPDSQSEHLPESPSASSDRTTYADSNAPSIDASTEVHPTTEHDNSNPMSRQPLQYSAKSNKITTTAISNPVASLRPKTQLQLPALALPSSPEPSVSCERCGESNIAFELHMRCEQCKDGSYDLCLRCWRLGRGCLNWYGFGQSAMARWNRVAGADPGGASERPLPHFLTGRRYRRIIIQESSTGQGDGTILIETLDPRGDLQLQSGFFCSNCAAFAQDNFFVCDTCNDGEWGYCVVCVNQGRCCTHPLLPVRFPPSTNAQSTSSIDSRLSYTTQKVSQLKYATHCNICASPIPPSTNRFHCPQCDEGDHDYCNSCYTKIVKTGRISEANGPQGWRLCLEGHRMVIVGFEDSARGQRYHVVKDLVGGHALNGLPPSPANGEYPPSGGVGLRLVAQWSYWPEEGDDDELAFPRGAEIRECENINNDWFWGWYCGRKGLFPGPYGRELQGFGGTLKRPDDLDALEITEG